MVKEEGIMIIKNYINGEWVEETGVHYENVENPSTGEVIGKVPHSSEATTKAAIDAAEKAFETWSRTPVAKRTSYLFNLQHLIEENFEELARSISLEQGKSPVDAIAEMKRTLENIQTACAMPVLIQGDKIEGVAPGIDGEVIRQPVGVSGLIVPYNFPAMVPFWFLPYAVGAGCTVVLKASQQVPMTLQRIFKYIHEVGFPKGVINLVNGDRKVADVILDSPKVRAVSFVGSTAVAKKIAVRCAETGKRFQALGSAKNYFVVMKDAKMDQVTKSLSTSCYGCAGQRCMAASVVAAVPEIYDELRDRFIEAAKNLKVGDALDQSVDVGPVVSAKHKQRVLDYIETGIKEGAKLVLDGRNVQVPEANKDGYFIGPTIFTDVTPEMTIAKEEIFGPVVVMIKVKNIEEALAQIRNHEYGNGASIFTQNGYYGQKFASEADAGMIGINIGIPAPVAYLPFGGVKNSALSDIKAQGKDVVDFFTYRKTITLRYFPED